MPTGRPDLFEGPRLRRLTGPRSLTEYVLPGPALTATALRAGRDAAWFTAAPRVINMPQNPLAFLAGNVLRTDNDLHVLAERSFDALLAAAPDTLPLDSWREVAPNVDADAGTPLLGLREADAFPATRSPYAKRGVHRCKPGTRTAVRPSS